MLTHCYLMLGNWREVREQAQQALSRLPENGNLWHWLGLAHLQERDYAAARMALIRAIALKPDDAEAIGHMGFLLKAEGDLAGAAAGYRQVLAASPKCAEAYNNLGAVLLEQGRLDEALDSYRRALEVKPGFVKAYFNLTIALRKCGRLDEALDVCHRALTCNPDNAEAHHHLGTVLVDLGEWDAALVSFRRALEMKPNHAPAHNNVGYVLQQQGQLEAALASYRRAVALNPDCAATHSNILFCLTHDENAPLEAVFAEHRAFADRFEAPLKPNWHAHDNLRDPNRRLRVGFVSGDLRNHAVATLIEPVWATLDPAQVEVCVYHNCPRQDATTHRLRELAHHWNQVETMSDHALAARIRQDRIDILCDLSGHTAGNRMLTFARKPAPIQVSWLGYPNTTGLSAIDYALATQSAFSSSVHAELWMEKIVYLPSSGTFRPESEAPLVGRLPALENGFVTFGSFSRPSKIGEKVIALWSRVLHAVPNSKMLMGNVSGENLRQHLITQFDHHGIPNNRLIFHPWAAMADYLALHHAVDIILDTFPYTGGTTTNHALWMGVPVLTLRGPSRPQCVSAQILFRAELTEWIATEESQFVDRAASWSSRISDLTVLRTTMRERLRSAPLRGPETVARSLEKAIRGMWVRWCAGQPPESFKVTL